MPPWQWLLIDADFDPVRGSEQRGIRPALIVSREKFNLALPNVTVVPLTTSRRRLYPSEVFLPAGMAGQPRDSIAMVHQVRTIAKERLGRPYAFLTDSAARRAIHVAILAHFEIR